jgi:AraC-like DNA-binding protein
VFVSIAIVRALVAELASYGVSAEALFVAADLDSAMLADPSARVPLLGAGKLALEAMRLSGQPDFALRLGASAPTRALHVVGHMLVSAGTARQAIALFQRYAPLILEGAEYELVEADGVAALRFEHPMIRPPYERFTTEVSLAFMANIGVALVGSASHPRVVRFRHEAPAEPARYVEFFHCPVEFGQPHAELVFDAELLDVPHLHTDERLCALLERRADELLTSRDGAIAASARVRAMLGLEPTLESLGLPWAASKLGVEERTLRRQLRAEDTSWSELFEREQRERACAALARGRTPIKEVAYRTGFSEPSAFHRAFKRWTGRTPAEYRRAHGPSDPERA